MISTRPAVHLLLTGLLSAALLVACGGEEERAVPATTPPAAEEAAPVTRQEPAPRAQRRNLPVPSEGDAPSQQLRRTVELPADFPSDAPIYPGTEPSEVSKTAEGRFTAMFGTQDSASDVMDYMASTLPNEGWQVTGQHDLPTGQLLQATKGDRLISVLLSRVDEGRDSAITMIALSVDS